MAFLDEVGLAELWRIIKEAVVKIGDIKPSVRKDLGKKWLLCDGSNIDSKAYPELFNLLGASPETLGDLENSFQSPYIINADCITYANGYWVVGGNYGGYARIAYTTDLTSGEWETKDLWACSSGTTSYIVTGIAFGDNRWVVCGSDYDGITKTGYARIAYSASSDIGGTWTHKDVWSGSGAQFMDMTYANGYFAAVGWYNNGSTRCASVAYSSSPSGSWKTRDIGTGGSIHYASHIAYADNLWAISSYKDSGGAYSRITFLESLDDGEALTQDVFYAYASSGVGGITFVNGYWVVCGYEDPSNNHVYIAYRKSPENLENDNVAWTKEELWVDSGASVCGVVYTGHHLVVFGETGDYGRIARIAYRTDLTSGEWTMKDFGDISPTDLVYADDKIVAVCLGKLMYTNGAYLPTLPTDECRYYIKALGD